MPSKQNDKAEVSKEKSEKKKTVPSDRKTVKKTAAEVAQKVVKAKAVSKKMELNSKTKFAKTKMEKADSVRKNINKEVIKKVFSEKNDHEKKSDSETVVKEKKQAPKKKSVLMKGQKTVILHSSTSSDVTAEYQEPKQTEQKPIKPEPSVPKTEEPKTALKSAETNPDPVKDNYKGIISINELITVRGLADKMKLMVGDVLK
jgi:translation initiation factor IF-2